MLLSQFQKIQEIDQKLNELHTERANLFSAEASSFQTLPTYVTHAAAASDPRPDNRWLQQKYAELLTAWQAHGISIPAFCTLRNRLEHAREMLDQISLVRPELHEKMSLVLVPPSAKLAYSSAGDISSERHLLHLSHEFLEEEFSKPKANRDWRTILAYTEPEGIYIGTPKQLLDEKRYLLSDYDAYALGMHEYSAAALQSSARLDTTTWTALLKDCAPDCATLPLVKFDGTHYIFSAETANSPFGDIRFRPAIEVK
jgi:hypothetical protein